MAQDIIVLTGAAGLIGSNVLQALNDVGMTDILVVEDLVNGAAAANLGGKKFLDYMDWQDLIAAGQSLPTISALIHLGANTNTQATNGREMIDANYNVSKAFMSLAAKHKAPFVYASSAAVYGPNTTCVEAFEHESPRSPYAVSKWLFDQYVRKYLAAKPDHPVIGLRFFNVYGPGEAHKDEMASVAYKAFTHLRRKAAPAIFHGSENIKRDFIYVQDAVKVILHFLLNPVSGIFNVGTGKAESFQMLAELCSAIANGPEPIATTFPMYPNYQFFTQADLTNLRAAGYDQPFMDLESGLRAYWKWFGAH